MTIFSTAALPNNKPIYTPVYVEILDQFRKVLLEFCHCVASCCEPQMEQEWFRGLGAWPEMIFKALFTPQ
jgi:hypothetical protein